MASIIGNGPWDGKYFVNLSVCRNAADHLTNASFCFEVIICDSSNESVVQIGAIDALASYGKQALNALTEVINTPSIANHVKAQGFKTIEDIKKNSLS